MSSRLHEQETSASRAHRVKRAVAASPAVGPALRSFARGWRAARFVGSAEYWEARYTSGGDSGDGSYGALAEYKARVLNEFVREHGVDSVIEWGCGDGNQIAYADYPTFIGTDVSESAVVRCIERFSDDPTKSFYALGAVADHAGLFRADLALSLDVIYHLVEDPVYDGYMTRLFASAGRYVGIYSTDFDRLGGAHVRHRAFTPWVAQHAPGWRLLDRSDLGPMEGTEAEFYFFERGQV